MDGAIVRGFVIDGMRRCPRCTSIKPISEFNRQRRKQKSGGITVRVKPYCKICTKVLNARRTSEQNSVASKKWRTTNTERARAYSDTYRFSDHGRALRCSVQLRRFHRQRAGGEYTPQDIAELLLKQNGLCVGCDADIRECYTIDHVVAVARGGSNNPENLQLLCSPCNSSKATKSQEQWLREICRGG